MTLFKRYSLELANWSLYLFCFSIGLFPIISSIGLVIFCIFSIAQGYLKPSEKQRQNFLIFLPIWGLLALYLLCLIYSPNVTYGIKFISRSLALFLVPFVLWYKGGIDNITYSKSLKFYIFGITAACILSLFIACLNYYISRSFGEFTYYKLADTLGLHPTYFSLFILTSLVLLHRLNISKKIKLLVVLLSVFVIILLQTRIAILGLSVVAVYSFIISSSRYYRWALAISIVGLTIVIFSSNNLVNRYKDVIYFEPSEEDIGTFEENGINQRAWIWKTAFRHIVEKPLIGYGLGAQRNVFKWKVEKELLEEEFDNKLMLAGKALSDKNLHNQYLQIWYECGFFGLLFFLVTLCFILFSSFQRRYFAELTILFLFSLFLFTESLLMRQMGIFFYSLIFSLFLSVLKEDDEKSSPKTIKTKRV